MSSNLSHISTSARSSSGSQAPPPSLSLSKAAASSAALTNADEADDFRRFLNEAQANDELQRQRSSVKANTLAPTEQAQRRGGGAAESLRRVASSSTLNSIRSQRSAAVPGHSAATAGKARQGSTSAASRAPRSVSNYSVTFRNPTSQFLEQLSFEAQTPELGIDDTPVTGRTVENKSRLTALGHAAQLQSRTASGTPPSRNGTIKGKGLPSSQPAPARASTIAVDAPAVASSRTTREYSQPSSGMTAASPGSPGQQLSPRRRPQSHLHTAHSPPSGVVSPRKLGTAGLGHGLPSSPVAFPAQTKRTADEMERSSSLHVTAKPSETAADDLGSPLPKPTNQPASRRKTWFGLGWAAESDIPSTADDSGNQSESQLAKAAEPVEEQPPPPMNEEEAAFRRSLGHNDVYVASENAKGHAESSASQRAFPASRDSTATIKAESIPSQVPVRERRISWLPWRNVAPPAEQDTVGSAATAADSSPEQQSAKPEATDHEAPLAAAQHDGVPISIHGVQGVETRDQGENTVTYRTVVKRGWMGARYEVQEPVVNPSELHDRSQTQTQQPQNTDTNSTAKSTGAMQDAMEQVGESEATYPPAANSGEGNRQASAGWRWRFWSGQEGQPDSSEPSVTQQPQVPTGSHLSGPNDSKKPATGDDEAVPMDIDQNAPSTDPSAAPESGAWTYSSYLASWVPTWAYNAQQQEAAAAAMTDAKPASDDGPTPMSDQPPAEQPPRTPAEQVKADALARQASLPTLDANKALLNSSTKSGWINFFASRSANLPREMPEAITNDGGLEVMDISDIEGPARPAAARTIAANTGRLTPDASRASRVRTTTGGSLAGSKASSLAGDADVSRTATPLSTSKDSIKNLSKTAISKAANASAASALGLGKGKRSDAGAAANAGSGSQPAKDISKNLAPDAPGPSRSGASTPTKSVPDPAPVAPPNLVLPSFEDTFTRAPRVWPPKVGVLERTLSAVNSYLFSKVPDLERMKRPTRYSTYGESSLAPSTSSPKNTGIRPTQRLAGKAKATGTGSSKDKGVETALKEVAELAQRLPRAWSTVGMHERAQTKGTAGISKIVVIGVHGWFTQSIFKNMIGEPTGTSAKFAAMQTESIRRHFLEAGLELNPEAITAISLQGDGKVEDRVDRLFAELISRPHWVNDLKNADAVFLSAHSQGAIVATQLLARLIEQRHVQAENTRMCLLAMCGIHHGPFAHLKSSITASYINYFETAAAKELFEFQSSTTAIAQRYTAALKIVLDAGAKCVYVGSTDDNVVPIYSALNSSNNHPSILRALYIDGQAFPKVDFLTNLLVMCVAVRNAGLSDHNLLTLLSASVAGSLYGGRGHSLVYEERAVYDLATRYLFEVTHPLSEPTFVPGPPGTASGAATSPTRRPSASVATSDTGVALVSEPFEAQRWNPYDLPWSLRGLFEDKHVRSLFAEDMLNLLKSYEQWRPDPKSKALRDLQWRLAPMKSIAPPPIEEGESPEKDRGKEGAVEGKASPTGSKL